MKRFLFTATDECRSPRIGEWYRIVGAAVPECFVLSCYTPEVSKAVKFTIYRMEELPESARIIDEVGGS